MNAAELGATLARWALRRPVTTCMLFLSMLLLGVLSSRLLPLEKFPGIEIPEVMISAPYPNSTPQEVERLITRPLEEALATMSNVKRMHSFSNSDGAGISLQFDWGENIGSKGIEAREKVDSVLHLLPADIERVQVMQFNTEDMPVFQLRISSQRDLSNAYDLLDRSLRRPIERVQGVSQVNLYGVEKQQIVIRLDSEKLLQHNLSAAFVNTRLQQANYSATAGYLEAPQQRILVNPVGEFRDIQEIKNLPITARIKLSDIAEVTREMPKRSDGRHLDQTYAIGLDVFKESSANLVEVSARVKKVIDEVRNDPQFNGINLYIMDDTAKGVTTSLSDLVTAGLIGALLSFIVLYLFLRNLVTTLVVVFSVPVAICIALGGMYFLGYSLNVLSLMGLMLAIGMLVDNAVVITESIQYEREHGYSAEQATLRGVGNVSMAVIAGTLTTAIVFLPNIFGKKIDITIFLEHTAVAICLSLLASLIVAQTLIPLLATRLSNALVSKKKTTTKPSRYRRMLEWSWRHPRWTGVFAIALLASIMVPMGAVSGDQDGQGFNDRLFINYNLHQNYSLDEVEAEVAVFEDFLYRNQEAFYIDAVYTYYTPAYAISTVLLKPDRPIKMGDLMNNMRAKFPPMLRSEPQFGWGNGGPGITVTLNGQSTTVLQQLAEQIAPKLNAIEGITDARSEVEGGQYEYLVRIDRERVHRLGLSSADVAQQVATALRGQRLRSFRGDPNGEIPMRVALHRDYEHSLEKLQALPIMHMDGRVIPISAVASFEKQPRLGEIHRLDRRTSLSVQGNLDDEVALNDARDAITQTLNNMQFPDGYTWSLDGSFQRQQEAENVMLVNTLLAVALIYIVMAALFESVLLPTAVITSLLFSIVGVFWALMLTGQSMSIMAMIGILILMGIVVNNGIVLVDRINQLLQQGESLHDAVIDGSVSRLRPILMTVATTVLGLIPLAFGTTQIGGDGPPYAPMAIAIIGGLVLSTLTSLFLVPYVYVRLLWWRERWHAMKHRASRNVSRLIAG